MPKLTPKRTKKVYLPDDPTQAWVEIIYLKPGVRTDIASQSNTVTAKAVEGEDFSPTVLFDRQKKRGLFFKEAVESWGGFKDQHSNDLPCTPATLELFHKEDATFYNWLQDECEIFQEEVEKAEAVALGN